MQKASIVAETFDFFLTNAPTPQNKPARTLNVRAGNSYKGDNPCYRLVIISAST